MEYQYSSAICFIHYRVLKDHTDSTGLQTVALDSFKVKLEEKEKELQNLQADFSKAQVKILFYLL